MKRCVRCDVVYSTDFFHKNAMSADGLKGYCKKCCLDYARDHYAKQRQKVLVHYGAACVCCGEANEVFLSVDHINGGGTAHRNAIGDGNMWRWIVGNNYPSDIQILCFNCNMAKGIHGQCPHVQMFR